MEWNFETHTKQGNAGLGYAIAYYTSKGHSVSIPLNDSQKYDLIVDINDILFRVQVKTTKQKLKNFKVSLRTISGRKVLGFKPSSFDILFVLTSEKSLYEIPSEVLFSYKNSINLTDKWNKYKVFL